MSDVWSGQEGSWAPLGEVLQVCPPWTWLRQEPSLHLDHGSTFPRSAAGSEVSIWEGEGGAETKAEKSGSGFISVQFYQNFQQDFLFPPSGRFLQPDARPRTPDRR